MILLVDNYDSFTWNLVQRLGELDPSLDLDRDLRVVRNDQITGDQAKTIDAGGPPSHAIISPGPCTPSESGNSPDVIRSLAGTVPVLGVCLGHQCIGATGGMRIVQHAIPVHGKTGLVQHDNAGVFAGLPDPFQATRYHSLVIDPESVSRSLAEGWALSAWTDEVLPDGGTRQVVMGLRRDWDRAPLEGVQFHPESFLTTEGPRLLANFLRMGDRPRDLSGSLHELA